MKKVIFGCALMLCGIIGGTGWVMAYSSLVEPGAWTSLTNMFPVIGFGRDDGFIALMFYAIAIVGAVIAVLGMKEDK